MLLDCDGGKVAVSRVGRFLLCALTATSTLSGHIRAKSKALVARLAEPLGRLYPEIDADRGAKQELQKSLNSEDDE